MSPEILALARYVAGTSAVLPDSTDSFQHQAKHHGLALHLAALLPRQSVPIDRDTTQRLLARIELSRRVQDILDRDRIQNVVIKGVALSMQLYGSVARRDAIDVDVLVSPSLLTHAVDALRQNGFELYDIVTPRSLEHLRRYEHELAFRDRITGLTVELQWALTPYRLAVPIDVGAVLSRSVRVEGDGSSLRTMSLDDALLYLAIHGANHSWRTLNHAVDFARALHNAGGISAITLQRAATAGLLGMLSLAVGVSSGLLGEVNAQSDTLLTEFVDRGRRYAIDLVGGTSPEPLDVRHFRENARDRLRILQRSALIPTPSDLRWIQLPDGVFPLYYAVRPLRLAVSRSPFARATDSSESTN